LLNTKILKTLGNWLEEFEVSLKTFLDMPKQYCWLCGTILDGKTCNVCKGGPRNLVIGFQTSDVYKFKSYGEKTPRQHNVI